MESKTLKRSAPATFRAYFFLFACLFILTGCKSNQIIVHGLSERDANEIIVFLATKDVSAIKVEAASKDTSGSSDTLWDIQVSTDQSVEAMSILNAYGLPRRKTSTLLEIFSKGGLVPSETEENIKYQSGLAEQIAGTIRKIDGVLDAEVQLSIPKEDPLSSPTAEKKSKVSASVYVKHSGILDDPNSLLIPKIRRLVSSGIPGLEYDNVTVIPDRARFSESPIRSKTASSQDDKQYVTIWTMVIGKESVTTFRVIFFSLLILVLLLALAVFWLVWKFLPLIHKGGGVKSLLHFSPFSTDLIDKKSEVASTAEEEKKDSANKPATKEDAAGKTDQEID